MPILLPEEQAAPLPKMHPVKQVFPRERIENIQEAVSWQMEKQEIAEKIKPGMKVAIAVGSRGIKNLALIVKTVIECVKNAKGEPYIVSAMGSHGGGTKEGQQEILASYSITEEFMEVPVITEMEVVYLGTTSNGTQVYFDKAAKEADLIIPINRIKLHTDFVAEIGSGLCKMLAVGLGNHVGCTRIHEVPLDSFGDTIIQAANMILEKTPVGFGIAVVENPYDETALIEGIPKERFIAGEKELFKISCNHMPSLMIPEIDVLIVEEIGKNISGAGFDPNILGKSYILKEFILPVPKISKMVLNSLSKESHGNGLGMGVFDVITKEVFDQLDLEVMYANAVASKSIDDAKIPVVAADEEEALRIAIKVLSEVDKEQLKIVKIKNTLELENIEVSEALLPYVEKHQLLER
jgi:hypothetical protein